MLYEKSYKKADELVEKARDGDPAARNMITELSMVLDFIKENSGNLIRDELEYSKVMRKQLDVRNKAVGTVSAVLWAVVIVLGAAAAYLIVRNILNCLNRLIATSERISKGDLSIEVLNTGNEDEIGKLHGAFHAMREGLIDIIGVIAANAKGIRETVEKLNTIASETLIINQEMVKSIESNAAGAENQLKLISSSVSGIGEINESVGSIGQGVRRCGGRGQKACGAVKAVFI